jgi:ligand-binding SRPBCC domain-containing protein
MFSMVTALFQSLWKWIVSTDKLLFTLKSSMPVSAQALFKWHASNGALERLTPPFAPAVVVGRSSPFSLKDGQVRLAIPILGPCMSFSLNAFHVPDLYQEGEQFADSLLPNMVFAEWLHVHSIEKDGTTSKGEQSSLEDRIELRLQGGLFGRLAGPIALAELRRMFEYRHR